MTELRSIDTPALVLDRDRMQANIARMRRQLAQHHVRFRPHVKTNKSIDVSRMILAEAPGAITVSTLREAEYFLEHGIRDMLYAVGIAPGKLERVIDLNKHGARLAIVVDNVDAAQAVAEKARSCPGQLAVHIEVDADGHRSGVDPAGADLLQIAGILAGAPLILQGVMTHAGSSYDCPTVGAIRSIARQERDAAVTAAEHLRKAGYVCPDVSVGSTPTALFFEDLTGVTEVRAGVFAFLDLFMAGLGVCKLDDIALSVLTTVIGHKKHKGWIIVDAGWMAMSRDRGTAKQSRDQGFGLVCDIDGKPLADLIISDTSQEHGIITDRNGRKANVPVLPVGAQLRILPNHACATGAQFDCYHMVSGPRIVSVVPRLKG